MRYLVVIILLLIVESGFAQNNNEIPFIRYLIDKGYYQEAIFLMEEDTFSYKKLQRDSLNYYKGWAYYTLKNLGESTLSLVKVGKESPFYRKSYFFAGYNQIYLGKYDEARDIFREMNISDEPYLSLLNFELSGLEMLEGDFETAEDLLKKVNRENATLSLQANTIEDIEKELKNHRSKSPFLAGMMSAIVPGSGKIYLGKTGAGIASMISTIGFGLITWENFRKAGPTNAKTIIFGSIFAFNYVSNIYGSVISVKVMENEFKNSLHNQILFQLHIPLRNFFD